MNSHDWAVDFRAIYTAGERAYLAGERAPEKLFNPGEKGFLEKIGCTPQELFDFIDDRHRYGEPSFETALLVAGIRRDYFLAEQAGLRTGKTVEMKSLPAKTAEVDGISWLPRLIPKARAKLRGEMPPDLMFCCGGDRGFFQEHGIHPSEFLHVVWRAGNDDRAIVDYVKKRRSSGS